MQSLPAQRLIISSLYLPSYYVCVCVCFRLQVGRPKSHGSIPNRSKKFIIYLKSVHLRWVTQSPIQ